MPTEKTKQPQIFLCHASEDKAKVVEIYNRLKQEGFKPWLDKKDLLPGQHWQLEISKAIKDSNFVLIFLSKTSVGKRGYVQKEFNRALDVLQEIPKGEIYVIPVRLDDCQVPEEFHELHWANLFEEEGFGNIIKSIHVGMRTRSPIAEIKMEKKEIIPAKSEQEKIEHLKSLDVEQPAEASKYSETRKPATTDIQKSTDEFHGKITPKPKEKKLKPAAAKAQAITPSKKKTRLSIKLVWAVLSAIILVSAGIYFFQSIRPQLTNQPEKQPKSQPEQYQLRKNPINFLSTTEVQAMISEKGFYDAIKNKNGLGIINQYESKTINGDKVVIDHATGLTWQRSGSPNVRCFGTYILEELNTKTYAGHSDWRLPTLEEAMSLMEPKKQSNSLYIDPVFDEPPDAIWSADKSYRTPPPGEKSYAEGVWVVDFSSGSCRGGLVFESDDPINSPWQYYGEHYLLAVR